MLKNYTIKTGDTAEIIARKELGDPAQQKAINSINNLPATLTPGQIIKIPVIKQTNITNDIKLDTTGLLNSLSINIGNNSLELFDNFSYVESLTAVRAGAFSCIYDYDNPLHVESFKFGKDINILANNEKILTGYTMTPVPYYQQESAGIIVYFKSAIHTLVHSDIAPNNFPLEFTAGQTLAQVARVVSEKFNISITVDADVSDILFDDGDESGVSPHIQENVFSFLVYMSRSRNVIFRDDEDGGLRLSAIKKTLPIAQFINDETDGIFGVSAQYDYEKLSKTYSVFSQYGGNSVFGNYINELFPLNVYKNLIVNNVSQGLAGNIAKWLMLRDLAQAVKIIIKVNDWYTPAKKRYKAGDIIQLQAPQIGIPDRTDLIIETVQFSLNKNKYGGKLICTLPECYTGEDLTFLPMI